MLFQRTQSTYININLFVQFIYSHHCEWEQHDKKNKNKVCLENPVPDVPPKFHVNRTLRLVSWGHMGSYLRSGGPLLPAGLSETSSGPLGTKKSTVTMETEKPWLVLWSRCLERQPSELQGGKSTGFPAAFHGILRVYRVQWWRSQQKWLWP